MLLAVIYHTFYFDSINIDNRQTHQSIVNSSCALPNLAYLHLILAQTDNSDCRKYLTKSIKHLFWRTNIVLKLNK